MAVRLYPNTEDNSILATLAGVSVKDIEIASSTLEEELEALYTKHGIEEAGFTAWKTIHDVLPNVDAAKCFLMFGWGRMKAGGYGCTGSAIGDEARTILAAQNADVPLDVDEFGGVCWG